MSQPNYVCLYTVQRRSCRGGMYPSTYEAPGGADTRAGEDEEHCLETNVIVIRQTQSSQRPGGPEDSMQTARQVTVRTVRWHLRRTDYTVTVTDMQPRQWRKVHMMSW